MDQSMICLPSDVKTALEKTNFIKRYEMLSNTFNGERTPLNERLRYIDGEIVLDSLAQLGYKAHFESKEKYFWIEEVQIGTYTVKAKLFCPEIAGLFCRIAGLFCHDSRANLSLKPVCFGIAIS